MRDIVLNRIMKNIEKDNKYNKTKLLEIRYGLETLYITITKTFVILAASFLLGTIKELLLIMLFYGLLRLTGFGLHAKKSWHCWISSLIIFLSLPYLIKIINLSELTKIIVVSICIIYIFIYAPADTEKRPLINQNKRITFKILCTLSAVLMSIFMIITNNLIIKNAIISSLIIQCIMISPITYKIFGLGYANYRSYIPSKTV